MRNEQRYGTDMGGRRESVSKREPKDQRFVMRLSKSELDLINKLSMEEDLPATQVVRKAIKVYSNYYRP